MKQIAQNYRSGELALVESPRPDCKPGGAVVRSRYSLISTGTEMMKVRESKLSLAGKAKARPDQVKKVIESAAQQGVVSTYRKVMNRLDSYTPLGYSLSGRVVEAEGVDFEVGQRVACGGNQFALHAEYNWVPRNLCVPIPDEVTDEHAAFTTVGAIAMQAFRQSEARLSESACVIGLGLVGQLLVQILVSAGVRVVGIDLDETRCKLAEIGGASMAGTPDGAGLASLTQHIERVTGGFGVDHVFIVTGTDSNDPVELAASLARDRARIVDVGKTKLDLPWNAFYERELEVRFSRSYGPGRYDPNYEERGIDYPIGYVRWTEGRNMAAFLDLLATGRIQLEPLVSAIEPFEEAVSVYERLDSGSLTGVGILFEYADEDDHGAEAEATLPAPRTISTASPPRSTSKAGAVRIGAIGCGNYASSMIYPHLVERSDVDLAVVATATSLSSVNAQRSFGFDVVTTDHRRLLDDPSIDAVIIATRHASHAELVVEALRAGKAVFVEKPLALDEDQLGAVLEAVADTGNDRLMVGFNRRFAPMLTNLRRLWGEPGGPMTMHYEVNAGPLDPASWYAQADLHGSRFAGEGGHFIDTMGWWAGQDPVEVWSHPSPGQDAIGVVEFGDGSIGHLTYATGGHGRAPKETFAVHGGGSTARFENFRVARLWQGSGRVKTLRSRTGPDKGQKAELRSFVRAIRRAEEMPIPLASLVATTRATIAFERSAMERQPLAIPRVTVVPTDDG